jgi:hypothetical protein
MKLTRQGLGLVGAFMMSAPALLPIFLLPTWGCASTGEQAGEERVRIVREQEQKAEEGGIPPDKQAEIQLLLQQRDPSTLKCYSDVLNDKHDRAFKGSVAVMLTLEPSGKASDVKIVNSTLNNDEVHNCLISKIKDFEFPTLDHGGSMQYVYHFQPAY